MRTDTWGMGDPMQIVTLSFQGAKPKAIELSKEQIESEHLEAIKDAEKKMAASFGPQQAPAPPVPPSTRGAAELALKNAVDSIVRILLVDRLNQLAEG